MAVQGPTITTNGQSHAWRSLFRKQFNKTRMCVFVRSGECKYGADCTYAHDVNDLTIAPDLTKTTMCIEWQRGCCQKKTEDCQFAHGTEDLRVTPAFGASFLRKRSQKISQQQDQHGNSNGINTDGCVHISANQENLFQGGNRNASVGSSIDGNIGDKKKKRRSKNPKVLAIHGALTNSQWQGASNDMGELFRFAQLGVEMPCSVPGTNSAQLSSCASGTNTAAQMQQMQHVRNGQFIQCRGKQAAALSSCHDEVLQACKVAAMPVSATEPQSFMWQLQMGLPCLGLGPNPQQVNLSDMVAAPLTPSPPAAPERFSEQPFSVPAQQIVAQRLQTPMKTPAMEQFCSGDSAEKERCDMHNESMNPTLSISPSLSYSSNSKSSTSPDLADYPSPIHRWRSDPSEVLPSPEDAPLVRIPSESVSPERQYWARTPSTDASPDLSPMRTKNHMRIHPMQVGMPSLLSVFNSGRSDDDEGFLPCRNMGSKLPRL